MVYAVLKKNDLDDSILVPVAVFDDMDEAYRYAVGVFGPDGYRVYEVPFVPHVGLAG